MDGFFARFGGSSGSSRPEPAPTATQDQGATACPVVGADDGAAAAAATVAQQPSPAASSATLAAEQQQQQHQHAARINMPVVANDPSALDPKVARLLSTQRAASTIPMSADAAAAPPRHQQQQEQQQEQQTRSGAGWGAWLSRRLPFGGGAHKEGGSGGSGSGGSTGSAAAPTTTTNPPPPSNPSSGVWMYPSEAQFFAAMRRKGWDPRPEDMANVVRIHNAVNERAWMHVLEWEEVRRRRQGGSGSSKEDNTRRLCACCGRADCAGAEEEVRLKRFVGRPTDLSPKARLLNLLGYKLPFDRHDWVVERCCGGGNGGGGGEDGADATEQMRRRCVEARYVIDFYSGRALIPGVPAVHLDVRPALDSPSAAWERAKGVAGALADAAAAGLGLAPAPRAAVPSAKQAGGGIEQQVQRILEEQKKQEKQQQGGGG